MRTAFLPISIICTLGFMDHFADGKVLDSLFWLFFPAMEGLMLFVGVLLILNFQTEIGSVFESKEYYANNERLK